MVLQENIPFEVDLFCLLYFNHLLLMIPTSLDAWRTHICRCTDLHTDTQDKLNYVFTEDKLNYVFFFLILVVGLNNCCECGTRVLW